MRRTVILLTVGIIAIPLLAQTPSFTFTKADVQLFDESEAIDKQFERRGLVYHDAAVEKHLAEIAAPLVPAAPLERITWRLRVLRDPLVNVFSFPNGSIYVNAGLIARIENDDQLAGLLAREITHTVDRDAYLYNRTRRKENLALELIAASDPFVAPVPMDPGMGVARGISPPMAILMVQGYGPIKEEENDHIALDQLKQAGSDPSQLIRALALMDSRLEPEPALYASRNHPKVQQQIEYLKKALALAQDPQPSADRGYLDRMRPVLLHAIQLDLDTRRFRSALATSERLVQANSENSENQFWLGESYRTLGPRSPLPSDRELTFWGQVSAYRQWIGRTEEEESRTLASTPEGGAAQAESRRKAEEAYRKATALDAAQARPYLGLGMLFEQESKPDLALAAYRRYLDISPGGLDKDRVERRIAAIASANREGSKGGSR